MTDNVVEIRDVTKVYGEENGPHTVALDGVSASIGRGDFVAVIGASGSGKSTFLHIVGLLDRPTSGVYLLDGHDVAELSPDDAADMRSRKLGFVFQAYNLLPRTTALENVELPLIYAGVPESKRATAAMAALQTVGAGSFVTHMPNQLSGGQQQRVAIARALVNNPSLILLDEPTGALDSRSSHEVLRLIANLNAEQGITILLVTHEQDIAAYARRIITFRDGKIESDVLNPNRTLARAAAAGEAAR
jgi:putative ABC transport system ATP-binding protein